jgi:hypothetical protein
MDTNPLLRPLIHEQKQLLEVAFGPVAGGGDWPIFQYIEAKLRQDYGLNAEQVMASLPSINNRLTRARYGLVSFVDFGGVPPQPETKIQLRVAGLRHADGARQLIHGFLWLLELLCQRQATFTPHPDRVVDVTVNLSEILQAAKSNLDVLPVSGRVVELVTQEPPLWGAGPYQQDSDVLIRLDTRLHDYLSIADVDDYLNRVWTVLAPSSPQVERRVASPLELVASADYLGAVWELRTDKKLWGATRLANAAALSFGCSTMEEFNSRLSALGDLLGQIEVPNQSGERLQRLEHRLHELVPAASHARIDRAVATLRAARRLRAGAQHDDAAAGAIDAFAVLGLRYPPADWQGAWDQIRSRITEAFDAIREELQASPE